MGLSMVIECAVVCDSCGAGETVPCAADLARLKAAGRQAPAALVRALEEECHEAAREAGWLATRNVVLCSDCRTKGAGAIAFEGASGPDIIATAKRLIDARRGR